jgi:hypothetical protein
VQRGSLSTIGTAVPLLPCEQDLPTVPGSRELNESLHEFVVAEYDLGPPDAFSVPTLSAIAAAAASEPIETIQSG